MAISDTDHALFVLQEYRKATASNGALKAQNLSAGEIEITTNLNEADAQAIADKMLAENVNPRVFPVEVEGLMWLNWFKGGPPQWMTVMEHDALAKDMKAVKVEMDFMTGITSLEMRG